MTTARCRCCKNNATNRVNFPHYVTFTLSGISWAWKGNATCTNFNTYNHDWIMYWNGTQFIAQQGCSYNLFTPAIMTSTGQLAFGYGWNYRMPTGQTWNRTPGATNTLILAGVFNGVGEYAQGFPATLDVTNGPQIHDCGCGVPPDLCNRFLLKLDATEVVNCCKPTSVGIGGTYELTTIQGGSQGSYGACEWEENYCVYSSAGLGTAGVAPPCWQAPFGERTVRMANHNAYRWVLKLPKVENEDDPVTAELSFGCYLGGFESPGNACAECHPSLTYASYDQAGIFYEPDWYCLDGGYVVMSRDPASYRWYHSLFVTYTCADFRCYCGNEFTLASNDMCDEMPEHVYVYPRRAGVPQ